MSVRGSALSEAQIRSLVGGPTLAMAESDLERGQIKETRRIGDEIRGRYEGTAYTTFEVEVQLQAPHATWCSCPERRRCKHVAALLLLFLREPRHFAEEAPSVSTVCHDQGLLRRWGGQWHVGDVLLCTVSEVPDAVPWSHAGKVWMETSAEHTLAEVLVDERTPGSVRASLQRYLDRVVRHRQLTAAFTQEASAWRDVRPEDEMLVPLWTRATDLFAECGPEARYRVARGADWGQLSFDKEAGEFILQPWTRGNREAVWSLDALHKPIEGSTLRMVGAILDQLFAPDGAGLRASVLRFLSVPSWQRTLDALDEVLAEDVPATDDEAWTPGWKVEPGDRIELTPVWLRPFARKEGMRVKQRKVRDLADLPVEDRAAAALYERSKYQRSTATVAEALVGHRHVIASDGLAIRIETAALSIGVAEGKELDIEPRVRGEVVPLAARSALVRNRAPRSTLYWDLARRTLWVLRIGPGVGPVLDTFDRRGWTLPTAARPALLSMLDRLEERVPLELEGGMKGQELEASRVPVIQLELVGLGMRLEAFVRPLPKGPLQRPGVGPTQLARSDGDGRIFVQRDLKAEVQSVQLALAGTGMSDTWCLDLGDEESMLSMIQRLQDLGEAVVVEWPRQRARIVGRVGGESLSVRAKEGRDWLALEGGVTIDGTVAPLGALLEAIRRGRQFVKVGERRWATISDTLRRQLKTMASLSQDDTIGALAMVPAMSGLEEAGATLDLPDRIRNMRTRLAESDALDTSVPPGLAATLRPYQQEGYAWMCRMAHWAPGACLADDMGLGKTVQTLALLVRRAEEGPALVVAPASVNLNWCREAARFAPSLNVRTYRGPHRAAVLAGAGPGDVLVTSYDLITRDIDELREVAFGTVVLDEAQAIKNAAAKRSKAGSMLKAGFVVALSGTPVENHVGELWSLFRVIAPGLLGSARHFSERFVRPIQRDRSEVAQASLVQLVRAFILRRTKAEVAPELPTREEMVVHVELSSDERRRYDEVRKAAIVSLAKTDGESQERMQMLAALTRMRQLACAPRLVFDDTPPRSSKIHRLLEMLAEVREQGAKALVFSDFRGLLDLVADAATAEGFSLRRLDGSMPVKERQREVDAFQGGEGDVFLISRGAGGTGLNLTEASYVFHLDPWWNPAREDQATDRAHRIGQDKAVTVYRLVSAGTIEDEVMSMHADKRTLARQLLAASHSTSKLSTTQLMALLTGSKKVPQPDMPPRAPIPTGKTAGLDERQ